VERERESERGRRKKGFLRSLIAVKFGLLSPQALHGLRQSSLVLLNFFHFLEEAGVLLLESLDFPLELELVLF